MNSYIGLVYTKCPRCKKWRRHYLIDEDKKIVKCSLCEKIFITKVSKEA